jgi:hypothetical protein
VLGEHFLGPLSEASQVRFEFGVLGLQFLPVFLGIGRGYPCLKIEGALFHILDLHGQLLALSARLLPPLRFGAFSANPQQRKSQ